MERILQDIIAEHDRIVLERELDDYRHDDEYWRGKWYGQLAVLHSLSRYCIPDGSFKKRCEFCARNEGSHE